MQCRRCRWPRPDGVFAALPFGEFFLEIHALFSGPIIDLALNRISTFDGSFDTAFSSKWGQDWSLLVTAFGPQWIASLSFAKLKLLSESFNRKGHMERKFFLGNCFALFCLDLACSGCFVFTRAGNF